jgi:arabinogalactan oligomer/maltooligosaccharide transport system permease protein
MMVVALGGLQSISATFYEAAEIDGATKWEQFKYITAPLLKPTMIPSIILSIIWTFNQFNVIYLITTQDKMSILVVSAYREAFEKGKYAYAAAYSVVIFIILALYSIFTMKMSKATEEVY